MLTSIRIDVTVITKQHIIQGRVSSNSAAPTQPNSSGQSALKD